MFPRIITGGVAGLALCAAAAAQEVTYSVEEVLQRVSECNAEVQAATAAHATAAAAVDVARSHRLPSVSASLSVGYLGDGTILDRDFTHAMRDPLPHLTNGLSVNLYQPVYAGGAITEGIRLAATEAEGAAIGVERTRSDAQMLALQTYFELMKAHNLLRVYDANIALTEEVIARIRTRHSQGTALRNDITRYELRLSTLSFDRSALSNTISILGTDLCTMLALPEGTTVMPDTAALCTEAPALPEERWQQLTRERSVELRAIDNEEARERRLMGVNRASLRPSVGIIAGDNLSGPVTFEIPAIDKNYNAWHVGVSVSYDISALWKTPKKLNLNRARLLQIDSERTAARESLSRRVHAAATLLGQARERLATERTNVGLATENYAVVQRRFDNDMALLTDMLDASVALLDSQVRLVNARAALLLCYYRLRHLSSTLQQTINSDTK